MDEHLAVDGIVGPATWRGLIVTVRRREPGRRGAGPAGGVPVPQSLRRPGKGTQIDGIFGPQTEAAVRACQRALPRGNSSVAVDGTVFPVTSQALVSGMLAG